MNLPPTKNSTGPNEIRPHCMCKKACLSGCTNTGQLELPFFADKMHGTFIEHRNLQHFGAQTAFGLTTLRQRL